MGQGFSRELIGQEEATFLLPHETVRLLGKGHNGLVCIATVNDTFNRIPNTLVVKKITLSHKKKRAFEQLSLLRNEIDAVAKVNHPNVLKYYGWNITNAGEEHTDEAEVTHFQVFMEYCTGGSLQERARKGLRSFHLRDSTRQILEGLKFLHNAGIVHGNLTCENIMVADRLDLHLKVGGFGRVKHFHQKRKAEEIHDSGFAPTVHTAPGVATQKNDWAVDIWGVGCVLLEMLHEGEVTEYLDTPEEILRAMAGNSESILKWFIGGVNALGPSHLAEFLKNPKVTACVQFLKACFQKIPAQRPTAATLLEQPFIRDARDGTEYPTEEQVLQSFTILSEVSEWMFQAVDSTGEAVIVTKRDLQLNNWMDEFVAAATVVTYNTMKSEIETHPQMMKRLGCWFCRNRADNGAFLEKATIISSWDYNGPFVPLNDAIGEGYGGFRVDRVKSYARQIVEILEPIWTQVRTATAGSGITVVDLASSSFLLNKQRDKISLLPLLFPEMARDSAARNGYISANIWDLGLLVLGMLQGIPIDHRSPGENSPLIPDNLDKDAKDFLNCCFNCLPLPEFTTGPSLRTGKAAKLEWTPETILQHPFVRAAIDISE